MVKTQRWLELIHEIEVRPGQTGKQLAQRFNCSERTILRDIERLPDLGVVIHNENGYRFFSKPFLAPLALSWDEVVAVILAQQLAQRQLDEKTSDALSRAVEKMRRGMGGAEKRAADGVERNTAVLPSGATEADTTQALLTELSHAVQDRRQVSFAYQGRDDQAAEERAVEPLGLSFQESRWYLHAFDLARQGERTFRLGRMGGLAVSDMRFEPKAKFSAEKAAFHQWDLGEGEPVTLTITASSGLARWFAENKPHPSVAVQGTTVTLSVNDPDAFLRWFASLDDAELTHPAHCRERLRSRLQQVAQSYG